MTKKSILEEALLEAQALEDAVKSNAKEILGYTPRVSYADGFKNLKEYLKIGKR